MPTELSTLILQLFHCVIFYKAVDLVFFSWVVRSESKRQTVFQRFIRELLLSQAVPTEEPL